MSLINVLLDTRWFNFYTIRVLFISIIAEIIIITTSNRYIKDFLGMIILFMLFTISIVAAILVYIYPKYINIPLLQYKLVGNELRTMDLFFHQMPLIIHLFLLNYKFWSFNTQYIVPAIIINLCFLIIYLVKVNPFEIYFPDEFNKNKNKNKK
jgi:hypothetical protein